MPSGEIEACLSACDVIEYSPTDNAADNLRDDIGKDLIGWKAPTGRFHVTQAPKRNLYNETRPSLVRLQVV